MNQRVLKRLYDALDSAEAVGGFIAGKSLADYLQNRLLRSGVERELEKAGEALVSARSLEPDLAIRLPELHRIIGLRHRIVHDYDDLNDEQIWSIAVEATPELVARLRQILNENGDIEV